MDTNMQEFMGGTNEDPQLLQMLAMVKELMAQGKSREEALAIAVQQAEMPVEGEEVVEESAEMPV